jgi:hypothetical protein
MKKLLTILLFFICLTLHATTYYVSTTGNDANSGSISSKWKTLYHASTVATASGDIIHIDAGTYNETTQCVLAAGVSIEGAGAGSTTISSTYGGTLLTLSSGSEGTNGNQHITGVKFDGNLTAGSIGIAVNARSNVKIYNCEFIDFQVLGVVFNAGADWLDYAPTIWATGNEFHDNVMTNCAEYVIENDNGWGCLSLGGQENFLCYNNNIDQSDRADGYDGYCIKFYSYGFNKGLKIYNNTLYVKPAQGPEGAPGGVAWGFSIELWNTIGGLEIYNNVISGSIDIARAIPGTYGYSFKVYNNTLGYNSIQPALDGEGETGIRLEAYAENVYIYNNYFKYHAAPVYIGAESNRTYTNINIYYNIMDLVGTDVDSKGWGVRFVADDYTNTYNGFNFWNNVVIANPAANTTQYGLQMPRGVTSNVSIRNNIIQGFGSAPVYKGNSPAAANIVSIEKNIFYDNGNSDAPSGTATLTNYTYQNNITTNPLFVSSSDFHLQAGSPGIATAYYIAALTTDYAGTTLTTPRDIGSYKYGSSSAVVPTIVTTTVSQISITSAVSGGTVTSDGGAAVTDKGICWSTSANPTTGDTHVSGGIGTGLFSSSMSGLTKGFTYHVRAFATNSAGTAYGTDKTFTTRSFSFVVW